MPPKRAKKAAAPPALPALDGCKIAFSGTFAGTSQTALKSTAESAGATVSSSVTNDTTHLVASEADYSKSSAKVVKAQSLDIPIVSLEWLSLSAQNNAREAEKDYLLGSAAQDDDADDTQPVAPTSQANSAAAKGTKSRKRATPPTAADPPADDDDAPKTKKTRGGKVDKPNKQPSPEPVMGQGQILKRKDIVVPLDEGCPHFNSTVYVDDSGVIYDASLNQTNSSNNNNKFYRIQVSDEYPGY